LSAANDAFTIKLLSKLEAEKPAQNVFISPFSIGTVLAMLTAGADGQTLAEMRSVLGLNTTTSEVEQFAAYHALLAQLVPATPALSLSVPATTTTTAKPESRESLRSKLAKLANKLSIANAVALHEETPLLQPFSDVITKQFNSALFKVNFKYRGKEAVETINSWVNNRTEGQIPKLFEEQEEEKTQLNTLVRMVLLNAVYFRGYWQSPFSLESTKTATFTLADGTSQVNVSMMNGRASVAFADFDDGTLVELPYIREQFSAYLFLPKENQPQLLSSAFTLPSMNLEARIGKLAKEKRRKIRLALPKFKLTTSLKLKATLEALGIEQAFRENEANFTRLTGVTSGPERLYLSEVLHRTALEINESGTIASAVTGGVAAASRTLAQPRLIAFNRPFAIFIREKMSSSAATVTLFAGVINKPEL
ncbi:serpin, partial [Tyrophagus putrescentiae]